MKNVICVQLLLVILLLGYTSCTSETEVINHVTNSEYKVTFAINNGTTLTRAAALESGDIPTSGDTPTKTDFTTSALEREKAISSLYAVVFNKTDDRFYKTIKIKTPSSDTYEFNMGRRGSYKLLLVANADDALIKKLESFTSTSTLSDYSALVATQTPGEGTDATDLLMVSAVNQDVAVSANSTTQLGVIELIRLSARFDFYNQVQGLKMKKITFKKRAVSSLLSESGDPSKITFSTDKVYTSANGLNPFSAIGAIYGYEDEVENDYEFILEATYNDQVLKPETITIKDRVIERNHLYNIILIADESAVTPSPGDPTDDNEKYKIKIHVADWNETETFGLVGNQLVNKEAPSFVANGDKVATIPATATTASIVKTSHDVTEVTIIATSASSSDSQLKFDGDLPDGWQIVDKGDENISHKDGRLVHKFTIRMTANTTHKSRYYKFKVINVYAPSSSTDFTLQQERIPVNPLKDVAEYNLASAGVFATEQSITQEKNGWFTWQQAHDGTIAPEGYHVPNLEEFGSIITSKNVFYNRTNEPEKSVIIHGEVLAESKYDSKKNGDISYALRFKDMNGQACEYTCAFRYQFEKNKGINITCRALGSFLSGDINAISIESYWNTDTSKDVSRFISACGYLNPASEHSADFGINGNYWLSDDVNTSYGGAFLLNGDPSFSLANGYKSYCYPVRVFKTIK